MNADERNLIASLFERLRGAESAYRDPEAEAFIADQVSRQPHAPYAMAQTLIVQKQSLQAARDRIEQLEDELEAARASAGRSPIPQQQPSSPWGPRASEAMGAPSSFGQGGQFGGRQGYETAQPYGAPPSQQYAPQQGFGGGGGGFLSGALQTAAGVAGGALLFEGVRSLFGGGEAKASEATEPSKLADASPAADDASAAGGEPGGWFSGLLDGVGGEPSDVPQPDGDVGPGATDDGDDWI